MSQVLRLLVALSALSALASVGSIRASDEQMTSTPVQATDRALARARQLCAIPAGETSLVVAGPNIQWSRQVAPGREKATALDLVTVAHAASGLLLAGEGQWVAVHDPTTSSTTRINCATEVVQTHRIDLPITRLAVSPYGDVALLSETGQAAIDPAAGWSEPHFSGQVFTPRTGAPVRAIHWAGRVLWLFDDGRITSVDVRKTGYSQTPTTIGEHAGSPRSVFAVYGLTYLLEGDGCIDVLAGNVIPRIREVTCLSMSPAAPTYVSLDRDTIRTIRLPEGVTSEAPRPLVLRARINGTVREITSGVQAVATAKWIPKVPLTVASGSAPQSQHPATRQNDWGKSIRSDWWSSPAEFRKWADGLAAKGWTDFHQVEDWTSGAGAAFRWQIAPSFVTPDGRSLAAIAGELYSGGVYTDEQLDGILNSNAALGRSLEGQLLQANWIPIDLATPSSQGRGGSTGFKGWQSQDPKQQTSGLPRSTAECRWAEAAVEPIFSEFVQNGIYVLNTATNSTPKQTPSGSQQDPGIMIRAKSALAASCGTAGRALLLKDPQFAGASGSALLNQKESIAKYGLILRPNDDANWPAAATGDLVIAVDARNEKERNDALRRWLDEVFRNDRLNRVLVPASILEMLVAADTGWRTSFQPIRNVTVVSAEVLPAARRESTPCQAIEFAERRALHDKLIDLKTNFPRTVTQSNARIGVVENSINQFHPMFVRPSKLPAWVFLDTNQRFVPVVAPQNPPPDPVDWHGMRVAGLLFSATEPTGLLGDVTMVWINAGGPSVSTLQVLAGKWNILNVSQKLDPDAWATLKPKAEGDWANLLFVAAAHNATETGGDGLPLDWQHANTIGVGVAHDDGGTPDALLKTYSSKTVDLLAPGHRIPTSGPTVGECVDGTSYATAYVTAVAALLQQRASGGLTPWQIRARLLATATWRDEYSKHVKGGLINADRALDGHTTNLLTVDGSPEPLRLEDVVFSDDAPGFTITGQDPDAGQSVETVGWEQILRLTRTSTLDSTTKQPKVRFFVAFAQGGKYRAWHDVEVTPIAPGGVVAMPISACRRRSDRSPVSCRGMDVSTVVDYIAQRPTDEIRVFF